jgi:hypothetical protein
VTRDRRFDVLARHAFEEIGDAARDIKRSKIRKDFIARA